MNILKQNKKSEANWKGIICAVLATFAARFLGFIRELFVAAAGTLNESDYFYDSYESMYNSMVADYENTTGLEWKSY